MFEHQTIFSKKELKSLVNFAFENGVPDADAKLKIIQNWQKNIESGKYLTAKEEEIAPQFLTQFFGEILNYNFDNPTNWNLTFENKTKVDHTKADAALGFFEIDANQKIKKDVRAVIEIKNTRTALDKPQNRKDFKGSSVEQAFMYGVKSGANCKWVIVSNMLEIRLYPANDMSKFERFEIANLTNDYQFKRFYYLLSFGQLFLQTTQSRIEKKLLDRLEKQKNITKEFYENYRYLRKLFFYHLKKHNSEIPPYELLDFAQKIIDRILFVSVVRDYELVPQKVLADLEFIAETQWDFDKNELWRQLKTFFLALDKGLPTRVQKFNGGLFRVNLRLDELRIYEISLKKLFTLNAYDFESDLSVNILGHIFEQSISDIEELKKEIAEDIEVNYVETDEQIDIKIAKRSNGQRKKDGIFYTPEYITRYIVKQSVGQWISERKTEIGINELADFPQTEEEKKLHIELWTKYQELLLDIKILDPACGSGAFLTQVFDFLVEEHQMILDVLDKLTPKTTSKASGLFLNAPTAKSKNINKIKKRIVSDNLFGVDLNAASVEITKLGLWLKTANKQNSLAALDDNIKTGNSLLDNKKIAGDKAFVWQKEFENIYNPSVYFENKNSFLQTQIKEFEIELAKAQKSQQEPLKYGRAEEDLKKHRVAAYKTMIIHAKHRLKELKIWFDKKPKAHKGFDVIVGNPPYVKEATNKAAFDLLHGKECYQGKMDLWYFFACLALRLVKKETGLISYIAPNNWISNTGASKMRNFVLQNAKMIEFTDFGNYKVFEDAGIQTMIYVMRASQENQNYQLHYAKILDSQIKQEEVQAFLEKQEDSHFTYFEAEIDQEKFLNQHIHFNNQKIKPVLQKIKEKQSFELDKKAEVAQGIVFPQDILNKRNNKLLKNKFEIGDGIFVLSNKEIEKLKLQKNEIELLKPYYSSVNFSKYFANTTTEKQIIYTSSAFKNPDKIKPFPNLKKHLDKFKKVITSDNKPYGLHRTRNEYFFLDEKIIVQRKCPKEPIFTYTDFDCYVSATFYVIKTPRLNQKYLTAVLNSKLIAFWLKYKGKMQGDNYQIDKEPLLNLPLQEASQDFQNQLANLVDVILKNKEKILNYDDLLQKAKSSNEFDRELLLKTALEKLDLELKAAEQEIDRLVYELYGLNLEEIKIIEAM